MVALGILLGTVVEFSAVEAAWPVAALVLLATLALGRKARWLARCAAWLALLFAGVLTQAWHRTGPTPEIDAGVRELVLVEGCVVEPTVFSPDRAQFTLELEP